MIHEMFLDLTKTAFGSHPCRVVSATYRQLRAFHGGGNTGSNPVGDAKFGEKHYDNVHDLQKLPDFFTLPLRARSLKFTKLQHHSSLQVGLLGSSRPWLKGSNFLPPLSKFRSADGSMATAATRRDRQSWFNDMKPKFP